MIDAFYFKYNYTAFFSTLFNLKNFYIAPPQPPIAGLSVNILNTWSSCENFSSMTSMLFNCLYYFKVKASVGQTCRNRQKTFFYSTASRICLFSWKCRCGKHRNQKLSLFEFHLQNFLLIFILFHWILTPCAEKTNTIVHKLELFCFISEEPSLIFL